MDEMDSFGHIKKTFQDLSRTNKIITLKQVVETSGVEDPIAEIEALVKKGIIIKISPEEYRWV